MREVINMVGQQVFVLMFRLDAKYEDENGHIKFIKLFRKRKNSTVIPPIGSTVKHGDFSLYITEIAFPISMDVVTCNCESFDLFTMEQVQDLIKRYDWREYFKDGDHPCTVLIDGKKDNIKVLSQVLKGIPLGTKTLGDNFEWIPDFMKEDD
jgi:hypothetical protein